jgi:anti-sigma B factor antagonist
VKLLSNRSPLRRARPTYCAPVRTYESDPPRALAEQPFGCSVRRQGHTSTIELVGELDLAARPTLASAAESALNSGGVQTVVADLTGVTFADSSTLGWLVGVDARMKVTDGRLVVVAPEGPVLDLLRITGIDRRLTLVHDAPMR